MGPESFRIQPNLQVCRIHDNDRRRPSTHNHSQDRRYCQKPRKWSEPRRGLRYRSRKRPKWSAGCRKTALTGPSSIGSESTILMLSEFFTSIDYFSRPSFAVDRDELYVQFTRWGEDYGRYPGEGLFTEESCMVTERCGPFRIGRTDDLQIFATIIVAITLVLKGF